MALDEQLLQKARAEGERFAAAERQALLARMKELGVKDAHALQASSGSAL